MIQLRFNDYIEIMDRRDRMYLKTDRGQSFTFYWFHKQGLGVGNGFITSWYQNQYPNLVRSLQKDSIVRTIGNAVEPTGLAQIVETGTNENNHDVCIAKFSLDKFGLRDELWAVSTSEHTWIRVVGATEWPIRFTRYEDSNIGSILEADVRRRCFDIRCDLLRQEALDKQTIIEG